jgi:hypothetical protein
MCNIDLAVSCMILENCVTCLQSQKLKMIHNCVALSTIILIVHLVNTFVF